MPKFWWTKKKNVLSTQLKSIGSNVFWQWVVFDGRILEFHRWTSPNLVTKLVSNDQIYPVWLDTFAFAVSTNLPVMVFIYGGAFLLGAGQGANFLNNYLYDGQEIADRGNVIVVTFNYRVGSLGFLSSGDADAPGKKRCKRFHLNKNPTNIIHHRRDKICSHLADITLGKSMRWRE